MQLGAVEDEGVVVRPVQHLDGRDAASLADLGDLRLVALQQLVDQRTGGRMSVGVEEREHLEALPPGGVLEAHPGE